MAAALGLLAGGAADVAMAGNIFTGQFGAGNTWNIYEAVDSATSFKEALALAAARPDPTGGGAIGHLVTIGSLAENDFVHSLAPGERWIGLTDRAGAAPGATESAFTSDQATQGWAWVTGEPFTFQHWAPGEPNNSFPGEDAGQFDANGLWNDNGSGFNDNDPTPDPPDFDSLQETFKQINYVIEWSKNLPTQPTGLPARLPEPALTRLFPGPLTRLPGPNGTADAFGVLEIRDQGGSRDTRNAIAKTIANAGVGVTGTVSRIDIYDPDNSDDNPGAIDGPQIPFLTDIPGVDDNDVQAVYKGTVVVPAGQGGPYTFNVHSDDGFALRVLSQKSGGSLAQHKFSTVRNGQLDTDGTLVYMGPTGDSNTQGVINLAPGTYDIEYLSWEDGGGAFWEVSTAKGDFVNGRAAPPRWLALGDSTLLPQSGPFPQAARLTAPATVKNFGFQTDIGTLISTYRANPAITAQGTVADVVLNGQGGAPDTSATIDPSLIHAFPNGGGDNFSTAVTGTFQVLDTNGAAGETLTFGLFGDDNAALHIVGQSFTGVGGDENAVIATPAGESDSWLVADYRTGNTNAYGLLSLPEGTYNFEAFQLEEGGGSGLQVFVASGDRLTSQIGSGAFMPLSVFTLTGGGQIANQGLGLVAGPGTGPAPAAGDFYVDGVVDGADFVAWQRGGSPNPMSAGDLATWKAAVGGAGVGAVPEPSAWGLMALAGPLAGCGRRRF
jgi:hypothetical protein